MWIYWFLLLGKLGASDEYFSTCALCGTFIFSFAIINRINEQSKLLLPLLLLQSTLLLTTAASSAPPLHTVCGATSCSWRCHTRLTEGPRRLICSGAAAEITSAESMLSESLRGSRQRLIGSTKIMLFHYRREVLEVSLIIKGGGGGADLSFYFWHFVSN